jgi:hypothetical protein
VGFPYLKDIGQSIHQKQESLGWGKSVVQNLARDLQVEFTGRNGFSSQNLWLMRQFYCEYVARAKLQPLVREISWAKYLVILSGGFKFESAQPLCRKWGQEPFLRKYPQNKAFQTIPPQQKPTLPISSKSHQSHKNPPLAPLLPPLLVSWSPGPIPPDPQIPTHNS